MNYRNLLNEDFENTSKNLFNAWNNVKNTINPLIPNLKIDNIINSIDSAKSKLKNINSDNPLQLATDFGSAKLQDDKYRQQEYKNLQNKTGLDYAWNNVNYYTKPWIQKISEFIKSVPNFFKSAYYTYNKPNTSFNDIINSGKQSFKNRFGVEELERMRSQELDNPKFIGSDDVEKINDKYDRLIKQLNPNSLKYDEL